MRRRQTLKASLRAGLSSTVDWFWHQVQPHLPVSMFLAAVFSAVAAHDPDWIRGLDSAVMRTAHLLRHGVGAMVGSAQTFVHDTLAAHTSLDPDGVALGWLQPVGTDTAAALLRRTAADKPQVTLILLQPDAWAWYLSGTTPVPRLRMACLLVALAESLPKPNPGALAAVGPLGKPLVVGIDIDIMPTESAMSAGPGTEAGCRDVLDTDKEGVDTGIRTAMTELARARCVAAIVMPRWDKSKWLQGFLDKERAPGAPCIAFADSAIGQVPHEMVFEYATRRVSAAHRGEREPHSGSDAGGGQVASCAEPPVEDCSLGRMLGALWREGALGASQPEGASLACGRHARFLPPLSREELCAVRYEQRTIAWREFPAIHEKLIARPAGEDGKPDDVDVFAAAKAAFADLPPADIYILAADDGTTADKFLVPVFDDLAPGAWVHAAIALTEIHHPQGEHDDHRGAFAYVKHVATDLLLALLTALTMEAFLHWGQARFHGALRDVWNAMAPALVVVLVCLCNLGWVWLRFGQTGEWHSPLLIVLGLQVHAYLHLTHEHPPASQAAPMPHAESSAGRRTTARRRRFTADRTLQWIWAASIIAAALAGSMPEEPLGPLLLFGTLSGLLYLLACRVIPFLPLPWRSDASEHPH